MVARVFVRPRDSQLGVTLVEVLVTLVILAIGLLGLVALQARIQVLQAEAYQRAQALLLLKDMAGRIANNRNNAALYTSPDAPFADMDTDGVGAHLAAASCPAPVVGTERHVADLWQWCAALQGATETLGGGRVGAMVGGRGCIEDLTGGRFRVTVAWQGLAPISTPPANVNCGEGDYDGDEGTPCVEDRCRRVVTTVVLIPDLTSI